VSIPSGHCRLTQNTRLNRAKPSPKWDFRKFAESHVPLARPHLPTSRIAFRGERARERERERKDRKSEERERERGKKKDRKNEEKEREKQKPD